MALQQKKLTHEKTRADTVAFLLHGWKGINSLCKLWDVCGLSFNSIDIGFVVNAGRGGFECVEARYLPIYIGWKEVMSNSRHHLKKKKTDMIRNYNEIVHKKKL